MQPIPTLFKMRNTIGNALYFDDDIISKSPPHLKKQGALYMYLLISSVIRDIVRLSKSKRKWRLIFFLLFPPYSITESGKQQKTLVFVVSREIFVPARCRTFLHFNESHIRCCQRDGQLMVIISKKVSTRTYSTSSKKEHWCAPRNNNPKGKVRRINRKRIPTKQKKTRRLLKLTSLHMTQNFS